MDPSTVIVCSGLPGTGKSSIADRVAQELGAPSFAGDWLLGALAPHGVLDNLERPVSLAVYFGLLETLVTRQLMLGQSAVVDCVMNDSIVARWTKNFDAPLVVVECVCSDEDLHRSRLNGRRRNIPGWHEVDWDHVERMRVEFPPLAHKHLTADSIEPLEDNVRKVLAILVAMEE